MPSEPLPIYIWLFFTFIIGIPLIYVIRDERKWLPAIKQAFLVAIGVAIANLIGNLFPY